MLTYQDLKEVGMDENSRQLFVHNVISNHKNTGLYKTAVIADEYYRKKNRTIRMYQKLLYTITGKAVPDNYSANWKVASGFFNRFVLQEVQHLLGNGVSWDDESTKDKLGKDFDTRLQELGKYACVGGVAFGFFNLDHLEAFKVTEFAPLYDEEDGGLKAGVRFWQVSDDKPLRATLYELDGYTDYLWSKDGGRVLHEKRPYILNIRSSEIDGTEIYDGENYPSFPIVPLWGNPEHQSELVGLREGIDCYDMIKSGFANDLDDISQIYWTIQNAGGMDDIDLAKFVERMKTLKAATVDDSGAKAESHTVEVPYASREALLNRIERDLYRDAMALDVQNIASGAATATQILAAYEPLDSKCDDFEFCVNDFLNGILELAGIENENPSFTRSRVVNVQEGIQTLISAATYLESEYVTRKILALLGDGDKADEMLREMDEEALERLSSGFGAGNTGESTINNPRAKEEGTEGLEEV